MIQEVLSHFPHIWVTCLGLLIFLSLFIVILFRLFLRSHRALYQQISHLPLQEEENP